MIHRLPTAFLRLRRPVLGAVLLLLAGCASTGVAPHAHSGQLEADERRLWARSAEEQDRLDRSGFRAELPAAEAYLEGILGRLRPPPLPEHTPYRIRILADPTLNAFAYPNGVIYVHTGLLALLENEAQLAIVLAHEATHATHRHGLRGQRQTRNATAFMASFTVGTAGLGALLGTVGTVASVSGHAKDLEREADHGGFDLMLAAGYDPREAPKAFAALRDEARRNQAKEPFFFGSHPRLAERITNVEQRLAALPESRRTGHTGATDYASALHAAFLLNARAALHAGDFEKVRLSAERTLAARPGDPDARLLLAEARRRRAKDDDLPTALVSLETLVHEHPAFAEGWRELGLVLQKLGRPDEARSRFQHYLHLRPEAPDRAYLETL